MDKRTILYGIWSKMEKQITEAKDVKAEGELKIIPLFLLIRKSHGIT